MIFPSVAVNSIFAALSNTLRLILSFASKVMFPDVDTVLLSVITIESLLEVILTSPEPFTVVFVILAAIFIFPSASKLTIPPLLIIDSLTLTILSVPVSFAVILKIPVPAIFTPDWPEAIVIFPFSVVSSVFPVPVTLLWKSFFTTISLSICEFTSLSIIFKSTFPSPLFSTSKVFT